MNEKGEKEMDTISVSQALQIAGRAGRFVCFKLVNLLNKTKFHEGMELNGSKVSLLLSKRKICLL